MPQHVDELGFGKIEPHRVRVLDLWRGCARNKQMRRLRASFTSQQSSEFEARERSHAVAEEAERLVQQRLDRTGDRAYQWFHASDRRFFDSSSSRREFDRVKLNFHGKFVRPRAKG